jgi:OmpA family protein
MTFRTTGPGRVDINSRYNGAGMLRALLYNFDFDDMAVSHLKAEHANFLRDRALPLLNRNRGMVFLLGQASQIGTNDYNLRLSQQRVKRVFTFLTNNGVAEKQIRPDAVGEEQSTSRNPDDPKDRSVEFVIVPRGLRSQSPPRLVPPPPPVTKHFRLRLLGDLTLSGTPKWSPSGGRLGGGAAAEGQLFEIQDTEHRLSAFYGYSGLGLGVGISVLWLSGTAAGPWNDFTTSAPMNVGDFGGFTRFTSAGVWTETYNIMHMMGTPPGVEAVYMRVNTGKTYGAGATTTAGPLQLVAGPMPAGAK